MSASTDIAAVRSCVTYNAERRRLHRHRDESEQRCAMALAPSSEAVRVATAAAARDFGEWIFNRWKRS